MKRSNLFRLKNYEEVLEFATEIYEFYNLE
jgi:hypothetical protein